MNRYTFDPREDGAFNLTISDTGNITGIPPTPPGVPPPPAQTPPPPGVPPASGTFTRLSTSQWKPGVGQADVVFGRVVDGAPANTFCQLITSGAFGVGPFEVVIPMLVPAGATTAGGNVAGISFVGVTGEENVFAQLSISADQNPAIYLTGETNSGSASICYGEDRAGATRIADGVTYAILRWKGVDGKSSNRLVEVTRYA